MNNIKILDDKTASKIAAGEVIERPAGVLKELLENSLDAGATKINVDIVGAGKELIRVNDNGCGISAQDLALSFYRHSTSKINNFEDLETLQTFGFRGEALFSIAAVSKVSMSSYQEGSEPRKIEVEGGVVKQETSAPKIQGTTVEIRDLFFNTPARLKFLKTDSTERSHLLNVCEEAALANPSVSFSIKTDGTPVYNLNAVSEGEGLTSRIAKIIGEQTVKDLVFIENNKFGFKAFVSPLQKLCASKNLQYFFVNKRPINCKVLQQALFKAYQQNRPKGKYPCAVMYLTLDSSDFDVNIHPQKREIKFADESGIFNFVYKELCAKLLSSQQSAVFEDIPQTPLAIKSVQYKQAETFEKRDEFKPSPDFFEGLSNILETPEVSKLETREYETPRTYCTQDEPPQDLPSTSSPDEAPAWWCGPYRFLAQLKQSYLLFENPQGLVLIDQHAAQERIYFEEFSKLISLGKVPEQPLMFPLNITLPVSRLEVVLSWASFLKEAGFEVGRFSAGELVVNSSPALLKMGESQIRDFISSFAQSVGDPLKNDISFRHKFIATKACKKAVKAGEPLSQKEAETLLENIKNCEDGLHCPHGRPTLITLELKDIIKKFGRTS